MDFWEILCLTFKEVNTPKIRAAPIALWCRNRINRITRKASSWMQVGRRWTENLSQYEQIGQLSAFTKSILFVVDVLKSSPLMEHQQFLYSLFIILLHEKLYFYYIFYIFPLLCSIALWLLKELLWAKWSIYPAIYTYAAKMYTSIIPWWKKMVLQALKIRRVNINARESKIIGHFFPGTVSVAMKPNSL